MQVLKLSTKFVISTTDEHIYVSLMEISRTPGSASAEHLLDVGVTENWLLINCKPREVALRYHRG